jgi:hypothetical protein
LGLIALVTSCADATVTDADRKQKMNVAKKKLPTMIAPVGCLLIHNVKSTPKQICSPGVFETFRDEPISFFQIFRVSRPG